MIVSIPFDKIEGFPQRHTHRIPSTAARRHHAGITTVSQPLAGATAAEEELRADCAQQADVGNADFAFSTITQHSHSAKQRKENIECNGSAQVHAKEGFVMRGTMHVSLHQRSPDTNCVATLEKPQRCLRSGCAIPGYSSRSTDGQRMFWDREL